MLDGGSPGDNTLSQGVVLQRHPLLRSEVIHIVHVWLPDQGTVLRMLSSRLFAFSDYGVYEQDWAPVMIPNWDSRTAASGYDLLSIPAVTRKNLSHSVQSCCSVIVFFYHENFNLTICKKLNVHLLVNLLNSKGTENVLQLCEV